MMSMNGPFILENAWLQKEATNYRL
jgi:hypothetical protein